MIWIVVGIVVWLVFAIRIFRDNTWRVGDRVLLSIAAALLSFAGTLTLLLFSSLIATDCAEIDYKVVSDTEIIALKDNQNVSGNFYIMGGYVNEDFYYYYATETEFGYKTEKVEADNAYIKYTDGETHIERYVGEFASNTAKLFGFAPCKDRYIIYCPHGTVANEFAVDLE